jgi:hypothetical protein
MSSHKVLKLIRFVSIRQNFCLSFTLKIEFFPKIQNNSTENLKRTREFHEDGGGTLLFTTSKDAPVPTSTSLITI